MAAITFDVDYTDPRNRLTNGLRLYGIRTNAYALLLTDTYPEYE